MEELARPPAPRSPWERLVELLPSRRGRLDPDAPSPPRSWLPVAVGVVAALVVVSAWVLRRPPDPVDTLPRAADEPTPASTVLEDSGGGPGDGGSGGAAGGPSQGSGGNRDGGADDDGTVVVHVAGAVVRPGVVTLPVGSRAVDAVAAAGGLAEGADPDRVNLAAPLADGARLAIPLVGQPPPAEIAPQVPAGGVGAGGTAASGAAGSVGAPVDLNTADAAQLEALPGIGPSTAQAIIAHRGSNGPFRSVDELLDVRGIGEAKLAALRDLVTVG
jgi:competence protein ComEA